MSNCALCDGEDGLLANLRILLPGRSERTPIYLCESCVADIYERNRAIRAHLMEPAKVNLTDWSPFEVDGRQFEWAARRSLTELQPSIAIVVRRSAGAAEYRTTYPDGTPLTDEVAREVARLYWDNLIASDD